MYPPLKVARQLDRLSLKFEDQRWLENESDPPPLKWSSAMFRKMEETHGKYRPPALETIIQMDQRPIMH